MINKENARKQFVCWKLKKRFMHTMNDYSKAHIFNNKTEFLTLFADFIGRDWLDVKDATFEQFESFCQRHSEFIAKPQSMSCGRGIRKICVEKDVSELYKQLCDEQSLVEEIIVQHEDMNRIHPNAVNTLRVATACINGKMEIIGACFRCGTGNSHIDNHCAGGIASKVDTKTGTVISDGCNILRQRFDKHPESNVVFRGFKIPHWDKVVALLEKAVLVVPEVRYVGWDIAVRKNDVVLVEGNFEGMFSLLQQPGNTGIKPLISEILKNERKHHKLAE